MKTLILAALLFLPSCFGGAYGAGLPTSAEESQLVAQELQDTLRLVTILVAPESATKLTPYLGLVAPLLTAVQLGDPGFDYQTAIAGLQQSEPQLRSVLAAEGVSYEDTEASLIPWNAFLRRLAYRAKVSGLQSAAEVVVP